MEPSHKASIAKREVVPSPYPTNEEVGRTELTVPGTGGCLADGGTPMAIGKVGRVDYTFWTRRGRYGAAKNPGGVAKRLPGKRRVMLQYPHTEIAGMVVEV